MKRFLLLLAVVTFPLVGIVLGQKTEQPIFNLIQQIGKPRPQGIEYNPYFDQFAYTDQTGRLLLVQASTLEPQFVLYEQGNFSGYLFSRDGRYLALAIDTRIEIWDTQIGKLNIALTPDGVLSESGTMRFSDDGNLLLFDSVVRAPPELRRSENDTAILPWMWDLAAARGERNSTLPGGAEAYPFFAFHNGLIIGPNDTLIAALPGRLQVLDGHSKAYGVVNELQMNRIETDPMDIWRSLRDDLMYVRPNGQNNLLQVNTSDFASVDLPLGGGLDTSTLQNVQKMRLSSLAHIIGQPNSTGENALLRLIFGEGYRQEQNYEPTTVTLLDILQPITVGREQMGLLVYTYYTNHGYGAMEFIRPVDIVDMVLSPDNIHLMVRRASNLQPIEIYNLQTGILEHSYFPTEPDHDGQHILSFDRNAATIITDFERINVQTGDTQLLESGYTTAFQNYYFTDNSSQIITLNGEDWRLWDIATGQNIQRETLNLFGTIVDSTPDARRYLTHINTEQGETYEIVEVGIPEHRKITIPPLDGRSIETIIPSADWQSYLVVYAATPTTSHYPGNEVAIYNMDRGKLLFLAGDDLPSPQGRSYRWLDNETAIISSYASQGDDQPQRVYGLNYDASGVPSCIVNAYPDHWQQFVPLWEQFNAKLNPDAFSRLTQRLCAKLPTNADQLVAALTPTPRTGYVSDATAVPLGIAGVPTCLTSAFPGQALAFAEAWRKMSEGLDDTAKAELEKELCEGLITSVYQLGATPTTDINQFNPPTSTPMDTGPITIDSGNDQQLDVMMVNILTGERRIGTYLPPVPDHSRPLDRVLEAFQKEKKYYPSGNVQLSPDSSLLAVSNDLGFIDIYRLSIPYDGLVVDQTATAAAEKEEAPRNLALPATATRPFDYVGQARPTLTPTVTPTPPPAAEATTILSQNGQVTDSCPSPTLYDLDHPPADYAASGRLFMPALEPQYRGRGMLTYDMTTRQITYSDKLPACNGSENCQFSFDQNWIFRQGNNITVSKPDGSSETVLFTDLEQSAWPQFFQWTGLHTLEYQYQGYLPTKQRGVVQLSREFDPVNSTTTDPATLPQAPSINDLPTNALSLQPVEQRYWLLSTDYGKGVGAKYYLYDTQTQKADYFARIDGSGLNFQWHPLGKALYYQYPSDPRWYRFDASTGQHEIMGRLPDGQWSRDGRYRVQWTSLNSDEYRQHIEMHTLMPKISVWDSETGLTRRFCIPQSGVNSDGSGSFLWSPDNRYLSFRMMLPPSGDTWPELYTPTPQDPTPTPMPTKTPIPLETQYQYQNARTIILDTQTGSVTMLTDQIGEPIVWTGATP